MPELCFKGGGNIFFRKHEIAVVCCNTCLILCFLNCLMIFEWTLFIHSCFRACIFTSDLHRDHMKIEANLSGVEPMQIVVSVRILTSSCQ